MLVFRMLYGFVAALVLFAFSFGGLHQPTGFFELAFVNCIGLFAAHIFFVGAFMSERSIFSRKTGILLLILPSLAIAAVVELTPNDYMYITQLLSLISNASIQTYINSDVGLFKFVKAALDSDHVSKSKQRLYETSKDDKGK